MFTSILKWNEAEHPRNAQGEFVSVAMEAVPAGEKFTNLDPDDDYLYHVTLAPRAAQILEKGLHSNARPNMGRTGSYPAHSKGRAFLTERGGVSFWQERAEAHAFDQFDDPPDVVVLKVKRTAVPDPQLDTEGTRDARAKSYYIGRKWDESKHPRDEEGQFTRVAMTSQRAEGDPGHTPNKVVFRHMRTFHQQLAKIPGVSHVSVKPGVGGWEGGSESMWQIFYRGNGEARKLVARTAKQFNQDAVLILNACKRGQDCQPAVELSFEKGVSGAARDMIHQLLPKNGIGGWTWVKRDGKTILRMICVPQWGGEAKSHQANTANISKKLRAAGFANHRRVHKVAVSVMEREGAHSYDAVLGG